MSDYESEGSKNYEDGPDIDDENSEVEANVSEEVGDFKWKIINLAWNRNLFVSPAQFCDQFYI